MRSFRRALALGCDAVEFDVHLSKDGVPVVIHDETLDRTTNGTGDVSARTAAQLKVFDAGKGERIPTLREVIDEFADGLTLQVEIKMPDTVEPVLNLVEELGVGKRVWLSSFWHRAMLHAKTRMPNIKTGVLFRGAPVYPVRLAQDAKADALHIRLDTIDAELMRAAHGAGIEVLTWNANDDREVKRAIALGIDAIASDAPDLVIKALRQ